MNLTLNISFKVADGDPAEEAKVRSIVAEESRKLAPAIAERLEAAGVEVEVDRVDERRSMWADLKQRVGL